MKELIPKNEHGLFVTPDYEVLLDSKYVSDVMGNDAINREITRALKLFSQDFVRANFRKSDNGYYLTRDAFMAIMQPFLMSTCFRDSYIQDFNDLEARVRMLQAKRELGNMLADAVLDTHGDFALEANMLYQSVTGMGAHAFRESKKIPKIDMLRPYLTIYEDRLLQYLQKVDVGLVYALPNHKERGQKLEWLATKWREKNK